MRKYLILGLGLLIGSAALAMAQPKPAPPGPPAVPRKPAAPAANAPAPAARPAATPSASAERNPEAQAIRQMVAAVTKAYNAGDAKALAGLFTADAETIDDEGNVARGRPAIQEEFAAVFAEHPQAKIEISVESIRFLSPTIAIEEGTSRVVHEPDQPSASSRYSVVHVKQDGKWQMASARDLVDEESTAADELAQLGWLVGDWVDESSDGLVKTSFHWTDNHRFIVGDFALNISGRPAISGTQRIGWDPLAKTVRSWVFDSEGGFGEGVWSRQDNVWIVKVSGVTRDGQLGSATNTYTQLGPDRYLYESHDRVVGGQMSEDTGDVIVVREPPKPSK